MPLLIVSSSVTIKPLYERCCAVRGLRLSSLTLGHSTTCLLCVIRECNTDLKVSECLEKHKYTTSLFLNT